MTKKIAVIGTGSEYTGDKIPPPFITEIAGPNFRPELVETRLRTFPLTPYDRGLTVLANLDCAIEAQKAGCDAVFINTVGDYGIDEIKSALDCVVTGAGEATMAMACNLGRRFSIVTIWPPKLNFIYDERIRSCGMQNRCVSVRNVLSNRELDGLDGATKAVTSIHNGEESIVDRILVQIESAINEDGADTIVCGCTCMAPIGPLLDQRSAAPVLEATRTGYKVAETLLDLSLTHSRVAFPKADSANVAALDQIISGVTDVELGGADCEICVISSQAAE